MHQIGSESATARDGLKRRCDVRRVRLRHVHRSAALGVEDERGELARQGQRETLRDEDHLAAGGDEDGAFIGGEEVLH